MELLKLMYTPWTKWWITKNNHLVAHFQKTILKLKATDKSTRNPSKTLLLISKMTFVVSPIPISLSVKCNHKSRCVKISFKFKCSIPNMIRQRKSSSSCTSATSKKTPKKPMTTSASQPTGSEHLRKYTSSWSGWMRLRLLMRLRLTKSSKSSWKNTSSWKITL